MTIEEFKKSKKMKKKNERSILFPFMNDIFTLRREGYSYQRIQEFLELNGIKTRWEYVRSFVKNHTLETKKAEKKESEWITINKREEPKAKDENEEEHNTFEVKWNKNSILNNFILNKNKDK